MNINVLLNCLAEKEKNEKVKASKTIMEVLSLFGKDPGILTVSQQKALAGLAELYEEQFSPYARFCDSPLARFAHPHSAENTLDRSAVDMEPQPGQ